VEDRTVPIALIADLGDNPHRAHTRMTSGEVFAISIESDETFIVWISPPRAAPDNLATGHS
jgi:hypothetical protein